MRTVRRRGRGWRAHTRAGADASPGAGTGTRAGADAESDAQSPRAGVADGAGAARVAGGYRLVRVLGEGENGVVHLGYADGTSAEEAPRTAAVKIHRQPVAREHVDREIAALTRVSHPHALHLDDVATLPDGGVCLILERIGGRGLGRLVAQGSAISAGEAVTILAPIVDAVHALHAGGVAHGRIRPANVLFRESGAPVLVGFGRATLLPPGASAAHLAANPAVLDDRRALMTLIGAVLDRVDDADAGLLTRTLEGADVSADGFTARLADLLFDLAPPLPVRFVSDDGRPAAPRILRDPPPSPAASTSDRGRAIGRRVDGWARALLVRARVLRPRVWVVAGGVIVSIVAAALVIPSGSPPAESGAVVAPPVDSAAPLDSAPPAAQTGQAPTPVGPTPAVPTPDVPTTDVPTPVGPTPADVLVGDDPVAALVALLRERERCVRDVSVLCLDGVLQPGSVAMQRDADLVRSVQAGGELTADAAIVTHEPVLLERLGDSALIHLGDVPQTQPASILVMRSEAGWRIRNYL